MNELQYGDLIKYEGGYCIMTDALICADGGGMLDRLPEEYKLITNIGGGLDVIGRQVTEVKSQVETAKVILEAI